MVILKYIRLIQYLFSGIFTWVFSLKIKMFAKILTRKANYTIHVVDSNDKNIHHDKRFVGAVQSCNVNKHIAFILVWLTE